MAITPPALKSASAQFVKGLAPAVTTFRKPRLKSLRDEAFTGITGCIFGPSGGGKTESFIQLVCGDPTVGLDPMKAIYINGDVGDGGYASIRAGLKKRGHLDKLDAIKVFHVEDYETLNEFLDNPWDEETLTFDPSLIFFDGFGSYQGIDLVDYVLEKANDVPGETGLRADNLIFNKVGKDKAWEGRKRATVRAVDKLGSLAHPEGKPLHKILTTFEGTKQVPNDPQNPTAGSKQVLSGMPLLSGFGVFEEFKGALTFLLEARGIVTDGKKVFTYATGGSRNPEGKVRQIDVDVIIPADMCSLMAKFRDAYKID